MHFMSFGGVIPKIAPKAVKEQNGVIAENLDLYGVRFLPHNEVSVSVVLLNVYGEVVTGRIETIHKVGNTLVGFSTFTSIAMDPIERLGHNSFLFVENNKLYRQSESRILQKKPPIEVGIGKPDCKVEPVAEVITQAGCKESQIEQICVENSDESCNTDGYPPQITAYKFTYVNGCGEESTDSLPSNYVEVRNGSVREVVKVVGRVGDKLTVERGQDNTVAQSFSTGACVDVEWNPQQLCEYIQQCSTGDAAKILSLIHI